jgi:hypothetical protein
LNYSINREKYTPKIAPEGPCFQFHVNGNDLTMGLVFHSTIY